MLGGSRPIAAFGSVEVFSPRMLQWFSNKTQLISGGESDNAEVPVRRKT
jgi:hypothetical protein